MSNPIPSFIDVTPFGPYCTQCSIPLAVEKGILQHGKARHPEIPIRNAFVVRAVKGRIANLRIAHAHDFSPFLKLEQDPHHIWFCTVCFSSFLKASNYKRHIEGHNNSCISVNTEKVGCFPTICGRMGPISCTVLSVVSTQSHLSSVSTVTTSTTQESPLPLPLHCHTAASTNVPPPLMTTQDEAITYLSPFVRSDEDVCDLALIYYPLLGPSFEGTMKEYLQYSAMTMPEEPMLAKWIEVGRLWLSKYAAGHISNVSANVRNRLAEFEQRELDGISVGTRTFALRRGIPRLMCELDSALRFFFRFPTTLFDEFKTKEVQLADAKFLIRTAIIPRILYTAAREEPVDHGQIPIACRYCLSRGFTTKSGTTLAMNECGWFSSRISALMHLLRAGVCGYLVTLSVQKSNRDLTMYEMELVKGIQHGRVTNLLAPYVKRLRDLNGRKPPVKNNTVNGNGDITSGAFTFSKSVWCTLIPRLVQISKNCFAEIFEGHTWQLFISDPVSVADWVLLDASTHVNGIQYFLQDLEVRDQIQPVLVKLQSIAELCLCGLGAGAVRHEEVMRLKVNSCQWHNSYLYFWTESLKQGSMKRRAAPKMVEHRLSLTLSKIFLLIRQSMKDFQPLSSTALICKFSEAPMLCLVRDIFDFDYEPMMLNVRHLFTSIGNILLPEKSLGTESKYVSSATLTEKSGHTQSTGRHSYSTWLENGEEALYDFYHKELGEEFLESPKIAFTPFSDSILLVSLKRLLGPQSLFRSPQQKQMVSFAVNSNKRHAYVSIPCGQGKSMSWFVPIMASLLSGRHIGLRIVILPYKFLLGHMVEQANLYFGSLSERIQVNFADSSTITKETFPSWLTDRELPSLLFLNLDAAEKMLCYHMDRLQRWANNNILKRIYLDELQQLIVEYGFRSVYQSLRKIGRVGVPVMCLSGSLPDCMAMSLMRYCSLTTSHNNESIDTVEAIDPVGDGYSLVVNIVDNVSASVVDFVSGVRYGACHVICESKQIVTAVAAGLSMSYKVLTVTGDSSSNEQVHCAKAWLEGSYDVLVSTVVALVGNENPNCKTIVIAGFLYNASNLVQAIGRLRPEQRGSESFVQVFRLSFHTQDRVNAKSASIKTFNEIVSANCLPDTSKEKFFHLFTPWGLQKFLGLKKGCLLEELSSYYGFQRPKCDRCTLCLKSSTISSEKNHGVIVDHKDYGDRLMCQENILDKSRKDVKSCYSDSNAAVKRARIGEPSLICSEVNSAKLSADKQRSQEQQIMRRAECVFSELAYRCIACSRADCIGECGRGCYRCGDLMHQTNTCTYNVTRLSTILCNKGVCFGCFDTKQRGIDTHNIKECPLKRRLKRLMFLDREKKQGIFEDYLRSLYASELSFLDMVASFSDRVTLGHVWMGSRLKKRMFDCIQIKHDDAAAPLLPPNTIHDSRDNSVDGTPRTTQHKNISDARNEYKRMSGGASSIRRQRKFVFGALYTALFPGFFMLDPLEGDFDLIITLPSNQKSVMQIRLASPNDGVGCGRLLSAVLALGRSQRGPGNARGAKVGDIGSMHAFGYRSARTKETFKGTDEHSEKVKTASNMMRHWMEDNMRDVLTFLLNADKSVGVANLLRCIPNGPGSRVMLSVNLGNSAHYDVNDSSISVGVWVEEKPGQSKNWYFILPNVSYKGSQGVVIKLHHGAIISWDGRSIYHCTSSTDVGFDNKVYGCMWGSSPM